MFTRLLLVDIGIALGGTISWALYLDVRDVAKTIALCLIAFAIHVLLWAAPLRANLRPIREWASERQLDDAALLAADATLQRLPLRLSLAYALSYLAYFGGIAASAWLWFPHVLSFGAIELGAMGFQFAAVVVGAPMPVLGWTGAMLAGTQAELASELAARSIEQSRARTSMHPRLMALGLGLVLSTTCWLLGTSWLTEGRTERELARVELREAVRWSARELDRGATQIPDAHEIVPGDRLPPQIDGSALEQPGEVALALDVRAERWTAAAAVGDGRFVLAQRQVEFDRRGFWIAAVVTALALMWWSVTTMFGAARTIADPVERLHAALRRVVTVGDLRELGRIPVVRTDEVGDVVREFNHMLDVFEQLAAAAQRVADGKLRVDIVGSGDLQDAFRNMLAKLAELVSQLREAAFEVASAAAEITAATHMQEQAASAQSDELREVSRAMERLSEAAVHISTEADEVLTNARHSNERADRVATELAELAGHVARIGALLQQIRDIAERSDLLALNGSLEATRAGEAGRGFTLVAAEMRRLAERVTTTVAAVRATMASVEQSNLATAQATAESRMLAERTTGAARRIVEVVETQGAETAAVSNSAREIADVVSSTASGLTQTRATADLLRDRSEQLEQLLAGFEL